MEAISPIQITLKLVPTASVADAEFWLLKDNPFQVIERFIANASDELINQLLFAIGECKGKQIVLLKTARRSHPPVLVLPTSYPFRTYLKLENVYLPMDRDLTPPLRRDAARKVLAPDSQMVYWLFPSQRRDGNDSFWVQTESFSLQSIPLAAFKPLSTWIEYTPDNPEEELTEWFQKRLFPFDKWRCDEDESPPPPEVPEEEKRPKRPGRLAPPPPEVVSKKATIVKKVPKLLPSAPMAVIEPSVLEKQLRELEQQFLQAAGEIDGEEKTALWTKLASVNAQLDRRADAALCWVMALWHGEVNEDIIRNWAKGERGANVNDILKLGK